MSAEVDLQAPLRRIFVGVQRSYPFKSLQFLFERAGFLSRGCVFFFFKGAAMPSKPAVCCFKWQGFFQGAACFALRVLLTANHTSKKACILFFKGQGFFQGAVCSSLNVQLSL